MISTQGDLRIGDSPLCYFCGEEIETLEHFFFFCERVRTFWKELNTILKSQKITSSSFDIKDIIFGLFHPENNREQILHLPF